MSCKWNMRCILAVQAFAIVRADEGPWRVSFGAPIVTSSGDNLPDDYRLTTDDNNGIYHSYACGGATPACKDVSQIPEKWYEITNEKWVPKTYAWCCPSGTKMVKDSKGDVVLFRDYGLMSLDGDLDRNLVDSNSTQTPTKEYGIPFCLGKKVDCMTGNEIKLTSHDDDCKCSESEYCFTCGPSNGFRSCTKCENYVAKFSWKDCGLRNYGSGRKHCNSFKNSQGFCKGIVNSMDFKPDEEFDDYEQFKSLSDDTTVKLTSESTAFIGALNNYEGSQLVFSCPNAGTKASKTEKYVWECKKSQKFELTQSTCEVYCDGRGFDHAPMMITYDIDSINLMGGDLSRYNIPDCDNNNSGANRLLKSVSGYSTSTSGNSTSTSGYSTSECRINDIQKLIRSQSTAAPELGQPVGSQLVYDCGTPGVYAFEARELVMIVNAGQAVLQCSKNGKFELVGSSCQYHFESTRTTLNVPPSTESSTSSDILVVDGRRSLRANK